MTYACEFHCDNCGCAQSFYRVARTSLESGLKTKWAFSVCSYRLVFLDINVDEKEHVYPMQIKLGGIDEMWLRKGVKA